MSSPAKALIRFFSGIWKRSVVCGRGRSAFAAGWRAVRDNYILMHRKCEICGYMPSGKLESNNDVHHIVPRHVDPGRICDESNLMTLCQKYKCHLRFGHFGDYRRYYNPRIREIFPNAGTDMSAEENRAKGIDSPPASSSDSWDD